MRKTLLIGIGFICLFFASPVRADYCDCDGKCEGTPPNCPPNCTAQVGNCPYEAAGASGEQSAQKTPVTQLANPLKGNVTDVPTIIGNVIKGVLGFIGALTMFMFVMGGWKWITSGGNAERVKEGVKTMLWAAVGVVIVFASYMVVGLVLKLLSTPTPVR